MKLFNLFYETTGVCTDTRNIAKDCLFICLKGANFNGNSFAQKALEAGAKYVIVDEEHYKTNDAIFYVPDSLVYLQKLATFHRNKFNIPIIGITGSNGKTSTKELINCVLSEKYTVLSTKGNFNNHIGVPLTLLNLKDEHEIAIIEMGANKFKDIEELCNIALPDYGIITNIGKAHLEGFINFEGVLKTKKELYTSVAHNGGIIVYNGDDDILKANLPTATETISFGSTSDSQIQGELIGLSPFVQLIWKKDDYISPTIQTNMIGKYNYYNFLAAISFGILFDVPEEKINHAIASYSPDNNRSQVKKTENNTLILDCYNANPSSMRSAIESFSMINDEHKILIIGDMLELGADSAQEHFQIAELVKQLGLKGYSVGPLFAAIKTDAFLKQFEHKNDTLLYLKKNPITNKLILLKGSRGIGLETLEESL
jgi:UDP-N-acetylmuramoyl-tripeptide--D-alanyl-D-alanine ligase